MVVEVVINLSHKFPGFAMYLTCVEVPGKVKVHSNEGTSSREALSRTLQSRTMRHGIYELLSYTYSY